MSGGAKKILVLDADLFPDRQMVAGALQVTQSSNIEMVKIVPVKMDKKAWDEVLGQIMGADKLIVL